MQSAHPKCRPSYQVESYCTVNRWHLFPAAIAQRGQPTVLVEAPVLMQEFPETELEIPRFHLIVVTVLLTSIVPP